jgi:hypothetical protein
METIKKTKDTEQYSVQDTAQSSGGFKKKSKSKKVIIAAILVIIIGLIAYMMMNSKSPEAIQKKQEKEVKMLMEDVSEHMVLPSDDVPAVFDITDPAALIAQQPFFSGAVQGDKLLVFPQNSKAIIYSPSREKIINVGPVTFDNPNGTKSVN